MLTCGPGITHGAIAEQIARMIIEVAHPEEDADSCVAEPVLEIRLSCWCG
jgi:hypothetical protein